ncbi:thioredoxin-like domain-containing protein [Chitinophagaceae bacterium LWZ2-11]
MKKLFILMLLPIAALAQNEGFTIKGNIKGLKDSTLVFMTNSTGTTIAQDYAFNGVFTLKGKLENTDLYQLGFIGYKDVAETFMGNETVTVTGSTLKLNSPVITGAKLNPDYQLYVQRFTPLREKLNGLVGQINGQQAGPKRDSLIKQFTVAKAQTVAEVNKFIKDRPASPISSFVLFVVNPLFEEPGALETKYSSLLPAAKTGIYAQMIEQTLAATKVGDVGSVAKDFSQNDTTNHPITLSSFKGKYVLVDFWASWCRPCRMENPNVVAAYNQYKNKNFTILSVSLDQDRANWVKAINDDKLAWTHVSDLQYWNNAVARLYNIQSIPQNLLIDPSGKIIGKNLRGEELAQKLQTILH